MSRVYVLLVDLFASRDWLRVCGSRGRTEVLCHCTDAHLAFPCCSSIFLLLVIGYVFISFWLFCVRRWFTRLYFIDALSRAHGGPACDQAGVV